MFVVESKIVFAEQVTYLLFMYLILNAILYETGMFIYLLIERSFQLYMRGKFIYLFYLYSSK